jgi:AcrR family transcriptional regulator
LTDVAPPKAGSEKDQRLEALSRAGSKLFNRRGIDGVSLDDVAAEVGATKGLIYHHFKDKPAFVAHCYDRAFDVYDAIMNVAETGQTGLACSQMGLELNIEAQIYDMHPLSLTTGFEIFSEATRRRFSQRTASLVARSVELARRGVKDGSLRPFDLEPAALASAGTFSYLSKWLPPGNNRPAVEIAGEISRVFLLGLRLRR